ncbi:MAG TPA: YbjN domain-containing protein [Acidimicrobiales bacterium]|nr:YbjN domain-containing protein [Acidimicrobiales bacterium]
MSGPASDDDLRRLAQFITSWAERERDDNPTVLAVDSLDDPDLGKRWFVRLEGEEKQVTTVWFHLRQRTLHYETQFMPQPEENQQQLYEMLLAMNARLPGGWRFAIGWEDAIYLEGAVAWSWVDDDLLDEIIGAAYHYTERWFRPCMRVGYESKFRG